jgi:hypothetical protein
MNTVSKVNRFKSEKLSCHPFGYCGKKESFLIARSPRAHASASGNQPLYAQIRGLVAQKPGTHLRTFTSRGLRNRDSVTARCSFR